MDLCSSATAILPPQKTVKLFSLDSRWTQYCLIFTELVLWDFPFAVPINPLCSVKNQRKEVTVETGWPHKRV